jgi:hypothetical protein
MACEAVSLREQKTAKKKSFMFEKGEKIEVGQKISREGL